MKIAMTANRLRSGNRLICIIQGNAPRGKAPRAGCFYHRERTLSSPGSERPDALQRPQRAAPANDRDVDLLELHDLPDLLRQTHGDTFAPKLAFSFAETVYDVRFLDHCFSRGKRSLKRSSRGFNLDSSTLPASSNPSNYV